MTSNHDRIEELIQQTNDPVLRSMLMLFVKLSHEIDENTSATRDIARELLNHRADFVQHMKAFDQHVVDEQKMIASVRGAWWVTTGIVSLVVAPLLIYILAGFANTLAATQTLVHDLTIRVRVLESANSGNRER